MITNLIIAIVELLLILRFHLELSQIDGRMEPINSIRQLTNPIVVPIKRLIAWSNGKKWAAIIIAYALTVIILATIYSPQLKLDKILLLALFHLIKNWGSFLQYGMFLFIVGTWIQIPQLQKANYILYHLFAPMLEPIKRLLPTAFAGIDFSPMIFLFGVYYIGNLLQHFLLQQLIQHA